MVTHLFPISYLVSMNNSKVKHEKELGTLSLHVSRVYICDVSRTCFATI